MVDELGGFSVTAHASPSSRSSMMIAAEKVTIGRYLRSVHRTSFCYAFPGNGPLHHPALSSC